MHECRHGTEVRGTFRIIKKIKCVCRGETLANFKKLTFWPCLLVCEQTRADGSDLNRLQTGHQSPAATDAQLDSEPVKASSHESQPASGPFSNKPIVSISAKVLTSLIRNGKTRLFVFSKLFTYLRKKSFPSFWKQNNL